MPSRLQSRSKANARQRPAHLIPKPGALPPSRGLPVFRSPTICLSHLFRAVPPDPLPVTVLLA
ncbi:hypothetical protein FA13DRAFT_1723823, partial [Coprinellus micaceus]